MGMFLPCLLAAVLNGLAMQIFREPMKIGNGPLMALYLFIFTCFLLLWSIRLYPRNLRRIGRMQFIIEFLVAEFVLEDLIIDFWFPLEKCVLESLPVLSQVIEDWLAEGDWSAEALTTFLKDETNGYYFSYAMAIFFLLATLHASRFADLRTLTQEGPSCFFKEIFHRMKLAKRRLLRKVGFGKKKVKINEQKNTFQAGDAQSSNKNESNRSQNGDPCKLSFIGKAKNLRKQKKDGSKYNRYCPLHNPCPKDDCDGCGSCSDDFEDLGKYSDLDC